MRARAPRGWRDELYVEIERFETCSRERVTLLSGAERVVSAPERETRLAARLDREIRAHVYLMDYGMCPACAVCGLWRVGV